MLSYSHAAHVTARVASNVMFFPHNEKYGRITMKKSKILKSIIIITGLIGVYVGIEILFMPVSFYASSGIHLGENISLLNEIRAPGGALLASGVLIILGAFWEKLEFTSIVLAALLYLSYGLSRMYSMAVDGAPAEILVYVAIAEIFVGFACAVALFKYRVIENE
jgi:hypothetical protein